MADFDVSPRKQMAMGGNMPNAGNFGAEPLKPGMAHMDANSGVEGREMADMKRGASKPKGRGSKMAAPPSVDHGPHRSLKGR